MKRIALSMLAVGMLTGGGSVLAMDGDDDSSRSRFFGPIQDFGLGAAQCAVGLGVLAGGYAGVKWALNKSGILQDIPESVRDNEKVRRAVTGATVIVGALAAHSVGGYSLDNGEAVVKGVLTTAQRLANGIATGAENGLRIAGNVSLGGKGGTVHATADDVRSTADDVRSTADDDEE